MKQVVTIVLCVLAFSAFGHGGEDHGAPPPAVSQNVEPSAATASDNFEVVVALEGKKLLLYIDRFASNEPVANATVEVEGAGLKGLAGEVAPGTYLMEIAAAIPAGRHPLTISIDAGETGDLLSATLDTSLSEPAVAHAHGWGEWLVWGVAALLLAGAALLSARRHKKSKGF
ncbi:MAG: hypothetical protein HY777_12840 [Betaproteobacteria bacterium]|nr:hypothetical protein [Betaproteobacteria bacterium]